MIDRRQEETHLLSYLVEHVWVAPVLKQVPSGLEALDGHDLVNVQVGGVPETAHIALEPAHDDGADCVFGGWCGDLRVFMARVWIFAVDKCDEKRRYHMRVLNFLCARVFACAHGACKVFLLSKCDEKRRCTHTCAQLPREMNVRLRSSGKGMLKGQLSHPPWL